MLFNEPKLLKSTELITDAPQALGFSALQRAEIAEMIDEIVHVDLLDGFSALQRAEIAEIWCIW